MSVIIPTYNRRTLVAHALRTVLAQTRPLDEIVVIDDGSTDGTREALAAEFGDRIRYVWQSNAGVSAARNHGLRLARGEYLTLLDSDDEWLPGKTQAQLDWLLARPDYGMVLCDVVRMDAAQRDVEVFRRRALLPQDGRILRWVLLEPSLVPASIMLRRAVYEDVGGFDESLATAEDLDFHLKVAARWPIGVVEQSLVRAMRGHDGLSSLERTCDDYVRVIERACVAAQGQVTAEDRARALSHAYQRNARGMVYQCRWRDAAGLARLAWRHARSRAQRRAVLQLLPLAARRALASLRPST